jgi:hypothetical protein
MGAPATAANNVNLLPFGDFETGDFSGWDFPDHQNPNTGVDTGHPSPGDGHGIDTLNPCSNDFAYHFDVGTPEADTPRYGILTEYGILLPNADPHFFIGEIYIESWTGSLTLVTATAKLDLYDIDNTLKARIYWAWGPGGTLQSTGIHNIGPGGSPVFVIRTQMGEMSNVEECQSVAADIPAMIQATFPIGNPGDRWASFAVDRCEVQFQAWTDNTASNHISGWVDDIELYDGPKTTPCSEAPIVPTNGEQGVATNVILQWAAPTDSEASGFYYTVDYGTDPGFGPGTLQIQTAVGVTSAQPGVPLQYETDYYWRVNTIDPSTGGNPVLLCTSPEWSFKTTPLFSAAVVISPLDDATDVEADTDLQWYSDLTVDEYKVYFGLAGGPLTLRSTLATGNESYNPHADAGVTMAWGTEYQWRIDKCVGGNTVVTGATWSFTTYVLQCNPLLADIDGSGDCMVNVADFAAMVSEWMSCNWDPALLSACP